MSLDSSEIARRASEWLPTWARLTFLASFTIGEGLRQLIIMLHPTFPKLSYKSVNTLGWSIFGLIITFPPVFMWRLVTRGLLGMRTNYDRAEEYISIIALAIDRAKLPKDQQNAQWTSIIRRIAMEIKVGQEPPSLDPLLNRLATLELDPASAPSDRGLTLRRNRNRDRGLHRRRTPVEGFDALIAVTTAAAGFRIATRDAGGFEGCGIDVLDP